MWGQSNVGLAALYAAKHLIREGKESWKGTHLYTRIQQQLAGFARSLFCVDGTA